MGRKLFILLFLVVTGYFFTRLYSALIHFESFRATITPLLYLRNLSNEDKMRIKYPRYYDYINWIKRVTPTNSIIYQTDLEIPYGEPLWPSNNIQMNSAWLYPRKVKPWVNIDEITKDSYYPTYIMIINGFPRTDISSSSMLLFNNDSWIEGDFIHDSYELEKIGLIKL